MTRTAHYVSSTHWDREWYEPFQGFRMRLVSLLDEVLDMLQRNPAFSTFVMDGQVIPIVDYLEVRPERAATVRDLVAQGRIRLGPWYALPDEWLVSGESLVRNLNYGMALAAELGGEPSRAGFVCDQFGHTGQLPQIFGQLGITGALVWRGTHEREHGGHVWWQAPDGTALPTYRFGRSGYSTYAFVVRNASQPHHPFSLDEAVENLVAYTLAEAGRSPLSPILLFDGGDHMEIEPRTPELLSRANERLAAHGIAIRQGDLDTYLREVTAEQGAITRTLVGELRESARAPLAEDEHYLIPGVLSSRIHLKQRNALCEDELCLWAEPWSAFAATLGQEYPTGYLRVAWRHLLENHPHDSICGCSIDQVHQDMIYRFDQSLGIASRLAEHALSTLARAAAPAALPEGALTLTVFNPTAAPLDEPLDLEIPLPTDWPGRFQEFFGFEEKFSFRLRDTQGGEIPYQLSGQRRDHHGFSRPRRHFPQPDLRHVVTVTARLRVPPFGYTSVVVEPAEGPTRYLGTMSTSHRAIENEALRVTVNPNGTLCLLDKRTGATFDQALTFEQRADIGDGWYHGVAVHDQVYTSAAGRAEVALVADGIGKATLRIAVAMEVPEEFDFRTMTRSTRRAPLRLVSDVTLRAECARVEVVTTVENTVRDHRLRVLFPTGLRGATYLADAAFDVVERPVDLVPDNALRRELDVETRPQVTWTAFGDGERGLAVVSRGLPESAVGATPDRPIALTLLRAFRRAVFSGDNDGGQIQGTHTFRFDIVPYAGQAPVDTLFLRGQRVNNAHRAVCLTPRQRMDSPAGAPEPAERSFLTVTGAVVITSVQHAGGKLLVRLFNPHTTPRRVTLAAHQGAGAAEVLRLDGTRSEVASEQDGEGATVLTVPPKRIVSVTLAPAS